MTLIRIDQPEAKRHPGRPILSTGEIGFRPSSAGITDKSGLIDWARRDACQQILANPGWLDQANDASGLVALTESKGAAGRGTQVHEVVSKSLLGEPLPEVDDEFIMHDANAVLAWLDTEAEVHASELFLEHSEFGCAGTTDLLLSYRGVPTIGDIKTSSKTPAYAAKWSSTDWAVQLGIYARSLPWDENGQPVPWADLGLPAPVIDRGLILHVNSGEVTPIRVETPDELVETAVAVQRARAGSYGAVLETFRPQAVSG